MNIKTVFLLSNLSHYYCVSPTVPSPVEHQICPAVCVLMKLSFDEEHRHAMNELGKLCVLDLYSSNTLRVFM